MSEDKERQLLQIIEQIWVAGNESDFTPQHKKRPLGWFKHQAEQIKQLLEVKETVS